MIRKNLLNWQLSGYPANHQNKTNLTIHLFTVPLVWLGILMIPAALFSGNLMLLITTPLLLITALAAQGFGHKQEEKAPEPFLSPMDFVSRFLAEQLITYPRWKMTKSR
jgi:hypothetical protein